MKATNFSAGKIGPQIIKFTLPIILGNLFMQLYQIVDSVIVGQYIGTEALGAVGASMPVIYASVAIVIGIGSGASVVISQYFGAGDKDNVRLTSDTLHLFLLGAGAVIAFLGAFFAEDIFRMMSLPEELMADAVSYLRVYMGGGTILLFGFNTISSILRGVGDSKTPLYFLALSAVLNVVLDLLFVVVFGWGVASVAWATVIASAVAYGVAIAYVNRTSEIFRISLWGLKFNKKIFALCVKYGLPTGIQQSFVAFGAVAIMALVNEFGADVVAGYSVGIRVDHLAVIPALNFGMALVSFSGQNVGANRYDRVKKGLRLTLFYSMIVCVSITAIIVIFGEQILSIFTTDQQVIAIAQRYLIIISLFYPAFNVMTVINGMLRGAGDVMATMLITLLALWGIRIPAAYILSDWIGLEGIWWSIPFGWVCGAVASIAYYRWGPWRKKSIFNGRKK